MPSRRARCVFLGVSGCWVAFVSAPEPFSSPEPFLPRVERAPKRPPPPPRASSPRVFALCQLGCLGLKPGSQKRRSRRRTPRRAWFPSKARFRTRKRHPGRARVVFVLAQRPGPSGATRVSVCTRACRSRFATPGYTPWGARQEAGLHREEKGSIRGGDCVRVLCRFARLYARSLRFGNRRRASPRMSQTGHRRGQPNRPRGASARARPTVSLLGRHTNHERAGGRRGSRVAPDARPLSSSSGALLSFRQLRVTAVVPPKNGSSCDGQHARQVGRETHGHRVTPSAVPSIVLNPRGCLEATGVPRCAW